MFWHGPWWAEDKSKRQCMSPSSRLQYLEMFNMSSSHTFLAKQSSQLVKNLCKCQALGNIGTMRVGSPKSNSTRIYLVTDVPVIKIIKNHCKLPLEILRCFFFFLFFKLKRYKNQCIKYFKNKIYNTDLFYWHHLRWYDFLLHKRITCSIYVSL